MGKFQILNHINPGKELGDMMTKRLGFNLGNVHDALLGNEEQIKALGQAAEKGRLINDNAEKIQSALSDMIAGTATLAQVKSQVLKEAGKAGAIINKSLVVANNAQRDYVHSRDELALQYEQDNQHALTGHQQRMQRLRNQHSVRMYVGEVDNTHQLRETASSLYLKQLQENRRYRTQVNDHYLQNGSESRVDLVNRREYVHEQMDQATEGFGAKVKKLLSFVGL